MSNVSTRPRRRRLLRLLSATAVTAAVGAALIASPALAAAEPALQPGDTYVALGSSYAAGAGLAPLAPNDVLAVACGRSTIAYPYLVADALDLTLINATCGGATTGNVAITPQVAGGQTIPLQIEAVTPETDLVTITIGGNDVNYTQSILREACLGGLASTPQVPFAVFLQSLPIGLCTPRPDSDVRDLLTGIEDSLITMVQAVQARAPHARIVLVDYLTVLPQNGKPCEAMPIPQDRQKFLLDVAQQLSLATKHAAQQTGVELVAASKLSQGHDACSADPWTRGFVSVGGLHPNAAGHAAVAAALVQELSH